VLNLTIGDMSVASGWNILSNFDGCLSSDGCAEIGRAMAACCLFPVPAIEKNARAPRQPQV